MNELFTVTRQIEFDAGHRIPNHRSKCQSVHGHRYKLEVTIEGPLTLEGNQNPEEGMVIDFSDLKEVMMKEVHDRFDHRMLLYEDDPMVQLLENGFDEDSVSLQSLSVAIELRACGIGVLAKFKDFGWVQEMVHVPTAENLAYVCYKLVSKKIDDEMVKVVSVRLWETSNSVAEYKPREWNVA